MAAIRGVSPQLRAPDLSDAEDDPGRVGSADSGAGRGGLSRCVEVWASTGGAEWFVEAVRIVNVDVGG